MTSKHVPVMLQEVVKLITNLKHTPKILVDATFGGAGYSRALLQAHPQLHRLIAFDRDRTVSIPPELSQESRFTLVRDNYCHLTQHLGQQGVAEGTVDGVIFDIGVSSMQLDQPERGFSFMRTGPLDMRMDQTQTNTAGDIIDQSTVNELAGLIAHFGDESLDRAYQIALTVKAKREEGLLNTTTDLADVCKAVYEERNVPWKHNPATLTFQALRIAVNSELQSLESALRQCEQWIRKDGGVVAVVAFQPFEHEIVDKVFRQWKSKYNVKIKDPKRVRKKETLENTRARSASLHKCIFKDKAKTT